MDRDDSIAFLFEKSEWNGKNISEMSNSHIVNTINMLLKRCQDYKQKYELFVLDHKDGKMLKPTIDFDELVKMRSIDWIKTTPIFLALVSEATKRGFIGYVDTVIRRYLDYEDCTQF